MHEKNVLGSTFFKQMMESATLYNASNSKEEKFRRMASGIQAEVTQIDSQQKRKKEKTISIDDIEEGMPQLSLKPRMGISASQRIYAIQEPASPTQAKLKS